MADQDGSGNLNPNRDNNPVSRPPFYHSASCPNIPELQLTAVSDDPTHPCEPMRIPSIQSGSSNHDQRLIKTTDDNPSTSASDSEATTENEEDEKGEKENQPATEDSAGTLVEAALEQSEAKDRHVRFQDHVVESAALVERMLRTRRGGVGDDQSSRSERYSRRFRSNSVIDEAELEGGETVSSHGGAGTGAAGSGTTILDDKLANVPNVGGSVLSSLMRLEAQRHRQGYSKQRRKKTAAAKKADKKPASLYDVPLHSSTDPTQHTTRLQRPKLANRPYSWLSTMSASNRHLVPSLEKKKLMSPSVSRRSSIDSMFTTASQFEPITLEDRIRITFEIANILQKQEFLRKLAKSLMFYGCPAHRLEYIMRRVSQTIGVDAEYVYMPNVMFVTFFDQATHTTETHFIRQPQTFDMHKLGEVYRLEKLVAHGEVTVDEALEFIDKVANEPPFYPAWLNPFVYALAAFCGCILFFGGSWYDAAVAAGLAMVFAIQELFSGHIQSLQPIWEVTICILIGFVAQAVSKYPDLCFTPIAFSAFIVILPGYPMAVAVIELVSRQLVSGVVRMVYSIIYSFLLGYGITMGSALYMLIDKSATSQPSAQCQHANDTCNPRVADKRWFALMVPAFAFAYCFFVRARPHRWPTMILVSATGYIVNFFLSACSGASAPSQVLQVVPAFVIGFIGNLLTKFTGKMSFDAVLLGVFYLVPGGLGIKAGYGMFTSDDQTGTQGATFALAMIESAIGITIGLFVATLVVYPKGTQHTPLMNF